MKRHTIRLSSRASIEKLAREQRVKPIHKRQDLYRHSVHDNETLDAWLKHLESLRLDGASGRIRKP